MSNGNLKRQGERHDTKWNCDDYRSACLGLAGLLGHEEVVNKLHNTVVSPSCEELERFAHMLRDNKIAPVTGNEFLKLINRTKRNNCAGLRNSDFFKFDRREAKRLRILSDSTLIFGGKGKNKISFRTSFEATYPEAKILSFDLAGGAKAEGLAALLKDIVQTEWDEGAAGMFDENNMIDCTLIIYDSNNDGAKPSGIPKTFQTDASITTQRCS